MRRSVTDAFQSHQEFGEFFELNALTVTGFTSALSFGLISSRASGFQVRIHRELQPNYT
jgi:hypothetical protein